MQLQHWRRLASFAEASVTTEAWRTDRQTDKKLNVFCCPAGGWNPSPAKLGMVIEDLEHVLAPLKLLGSDAQFRRYGALKIWLQPDTVNLKLP